jgi:hypothetical protein
MRTIVLIRGYSQSGKDFIGKALCQHFRFQRFAFADSLKRIVARIYQCPIDVLHSQSGKQRICEQDEQKRSYRQILIDEALRLRAIDDTVFARECCQDIMKQQNTTKVVITDWRYPIEYTMLVEQFPNDLIIPLQVVRNDIEESPVDDISEHHLDDRVGDYKLVNSMNVYVHQDIYRFIQHINTLKSARAEHTQPAIRF